MGSGDPGPGPRCRRTAVDRAQPDRARPRPAGAGRGGAGDRGPSARDPLPDPARARRARARARARFAARSMPSRRSSSWSSCRRSCTWPPSSPRRGSSAPGRELDLEAGGRAGPGHDRGRGGGRPRRGSRSWPWSVPSCSARSSRHPDAIAATAVEIQQLGAPRAAGHDPGGREPDQRRDRAGRLSGAALAAAVTGQLRARATPACAFAFAALGGVERSGCWSRCTIGAQLRRRASTIRAVEIVISLLRPVRGLPAGRGARHLGRAGRRRGRPLPRGTARAQGLMEAETRLSGRAVSRRSDLRAERAGLHPDRPPATGRSGRPIEPGQRPVAARARPAGQPDRRWASGWPGSAWGGGGGGASTGWEGQPPGQHGRPWPIVLVLGWAGMRGVVSLATALALPAALPDGQPFPERDLLVFLDVLRDPGHPGRPGAQPALDNASAGRQAATPPTTSRRSAAPARPRPRRRSRASRELSAEWPGHLPLIDALRAQYAHRQSHESERAGRLGRRPRPRPGQGAGDARAPRDPPRDHRGGEAPGRAPAPTPRAPCTTRSTAASSATSTSRPLRSGA